MTGATSERTGPVWRVYPDAEALATQLTQTVLNEARDRIAQHGRFMLVLAGGATPRRVYLKLAQAEADWGRWHIWFGDERCYPLGHSERNDTMAQGALLTRVPIPRDNIHPICSEGFGPEAAARRYAEVLPQGRFDLTLLGLGEDGHTASLFPGNDWGETDESAAVLPVLNAPKPPAERVSLSAHRLSQSFRVIFLVTGASKANAVARWKTGDARPASAIHAPKLEVWLDQAAAN
jgi:6-phosphogluconolactonase